ncbi:MAG: hypothetical protein K8T25_00855 [Planctomycetia bacterium]|nr:hypothetical protein [Planctomycetia bacterium]
MTHPKELVERTANLIVSKFDVPPERAGRMAERAMDGIDAHGLDPHDWETIQEVIEVVVRSWVENDLVP